VARRVNLHELTVFPNGKHDDQADSTAQFSWIASRSPFRARDTTSGCGRSMSACKIRRRIASAIGFSWRGALVGQRKPVRPKSQRS
jgi:hypothetical protein